MSKSERIQTWMEGKPLVIIRDGTFIWETLNRENITHDEFFMELRQEGVEHLGQVRLAILEVNGSISVYFLMTIMCVMDCLFCPTAALKSR